MKRAQEPRFEVAPCKEFADDHGVTSTEMVQDPWVAEFWTVYLRRDGLAEALVDVGSYREAVTWLRDRGEGTWFLYTPHGYVEEGAKR